MIEPYVFWCSPCKTRHSGECPPKIRWVNGSKWRGELSDDEGVTWRSNSYTYVVLDQRINGMCIKVSMFYDYDNAQSAKAEDDKPVECWSEKGWPFRRTDGSPRPRRLRMVPA